MKSLTDLEDDLVNRVAAHRVVMPRDDAERKRCERLYQKGWLLRARHHAGHYYYLSFKATRHLKIHRLYCRPPGYTALVRALGCMLVCDHFGYERVSPWQFERDFPELCAAGVSQGSYCFGDESIGFIHVDVAQPAKGINRRAQEIVVQRLAIPAFAQLIDRGKFFIVVVTAEERKRRQIDTCLTEPRASVVALPELLEVL